VDTRTRSDGPSHQAGSTVVGVTDTPSATPPPWRGRDVPPGEPTDPRSGLPSPAADDRTQVDASFGDHTLVQPIPTQPPHPPHAPYPPYPYGAPYPPYGGGYPPPRPPRRWLAWAGAAGILGLAVIVVAALFNPKTPTASGPTTAATARASITPAPTTSTTIDAKGPGASADAPAARGTAVKPAKGWTVAVTDVDLDATSEMAKAAWYARPAPGKQYVLVTVTATHDGAQQATFFGEVKLSLHTAKGGSHGPNLINPARNRLEIGVQVPPQGSKSGTVLFELPKADVAGAVLVAEPMFTRDQAEDQRYLALR
jgi:hypothetical protein